MLGGDKLCPKNTKTTINCWFVYCELGFLSLFPMVSFESHFRLMWLFNDCLGMFHAWGSACALAINTWFMWGHLRLLLGDCIRETITNDRIFSIKTEYIPLHYNAKLVINKFTGFWPLLPRIHSWRIIRYSKRWYQMRSTSLTRSLVTDHMQHWITLFFIMWQVHHYTNLLRLYFDYSLFSACSYVYRHK